MPRGRVAGVVLLALVLGTASAAPAVESDLARARADHARLLALDRALAARLEQIIAGAGRDDGDGIAAQYD